MPLQRVLDEDLELLDVVPVRDRHVARTEALAEVVELWQRWSGPRLVDNQPEDGLGLLLLGGLLLRRVDLVGKTSYELLGPGDLIPVNGTDPNGAFLPHQVTWRALDDARLALLDGSFSDRIARWPQLSNAISARGLSRMSSISLERALTQHRADVRIDLLLWYLAGRWGKVIGDGLIRIELPLTHEIIGHVAGCSRQTASWALSRLAKLRLTRRENGRWLLHGSLKYHLSLLGPEAQA
jgi:CRP/FNR family transcriptional regulator, cyclic AMP receptor protein